MNNVEPFVFVTSLNEKLFLDYGENFINSWLKNADLNLVLVVVHEEISRHIGSLYAITLFPCLLIALNVSSFATSFKSFRMPEE